jgi:hypothetical protein
VLAEREVVTSETTTSEPRASRLSFLPTNTKSPWDIYLEQIARVAPHLPKNLQYWLETLKRPKRILFVDVPILFDNCAFSGRQPYLGVQDTPRKGLHNSGWTPSPGHALVTDKTQWGALKNMYKRFWKTLQMTNVSSVGTCTMNLATLAWARKVWSCSSPLSRGQGKSKYCNL